MLLPYPKAVITSVLFSALTFCTANAQQWNVLGKPDFSGAGAEAPTMVVNAAGTPYVAYKDAANGNAATVMANSGTGWAAVGAEGFSSTISSFVSITLDKTGTPYVVYTNQNAGDAAQVMTYNGSWSLVGANYASDLLATFTDIAIDTAGDTINRPYIVYIDGKNYFKICVKRYFAGNWEYVGAPDFSVSEADYCHIKISRTGVPYVVFQDAYSNYKATVMTFNGTQWVNLGSQGFSAGTATYTDIVLDTNDIPYVVYSDGAHKGKATVMKYSEGNWVNVGTAGFSDTNANFTTIAIGANNLPYVAFADGGTSTWPGPATAMEFNGTAWVVMCAPGISPGGAGYPVIATATQQDMFYVSFMDYSDSNRVTVLSNNGVTPCFGAGVPNVAAAAGFSIYPNPAYDELGVVSAADPIKQITVANLLGQTVCSMQPNATSAQVPVGNLPCGVYFIKVDNAAVQKFVKE